MSFVRIREEEEEGKEKREKEMKEEADWPKQSFKVMPKIVNAV